MQIGESGVESRSVWSSGLFLNCITNRRKWRPESGSCGHLGSDREGSRGPRFESICGAQIASQIAESGDGSEVLAVDPRLHYESAKARGDKRFMLPSGFGSGRGRQTLGLGRPASPKLHYKSTKVRVEPRTYRRYHELCATFDQFSFLNLFLLSCSI